MQHLRHPAEPLRLQPDGIGFRGHDHDQHSENPGGTPVAPGLTATDAPINATRGGQQIDPAVATSASGNYVVVWTSDINGQTNIVGQLYKSSGSLVGVGVHREYHGFDFLGQSGRGHGCGTATSS